MKKDPLFLIIHIKECITCIRQYIKGLHKTAFSKDSQVQDAIIRRLEIIGEAAKQVPEKMRRDHPSIPWSKMAKFRDLAIHHYENLDCDHIWNIAKRDIPSLEKEIDEILDEHEYDPETYKAPSSLLRETR